MGLGLVQVGGQAEPQLLNCWPLIGHPGMCVWKRGVTLVITGTMCTVAPDLSSRNIIIMPTVPAISQEFTTLQINWKHK